MPLLPVLAGVGRAIVKGAASSYAKSFPRTIVGRAIRSTLPIAAGTYVGTKIGGPQTGGGQLPALPGGVQLPAVYGGTSGTGILPKGAGGKLQFPWSDPRVPEFLRAFALDDQFLRVCYRAPKGYVVVRDPAGKPYPVLKMMAQKMGLWRPAARPPISATDWKHYRRARAIEKKLLKIARPAIRKHATRAAQASIAHHRKVR